VSVHTCCLMLLLAISLQPMVTSVDFTSHPQIQGYPCSTIHSLACPSPACPTL
jgi:hypothetical protein